MTNKEIAKKLYEDENIVFGIREDSMRILSASHRWS